MTTAEKVLQKLGLIKLEAEKVALEQYEIEGGSVVEVDGELEVGKELFTVSEDGTQVPGINGDYKLTDGRLVVVSEGKITEIKEAEAETEETEEETEVEIEMSEGEKALNARLKAIEEKMIQMSTENEALKLQLDETKSTNEMLQTELSAIKEENESPAFNPMRGQVRMGKEVVDLKSLPSAKERALAKLKSTK